MISSELLSFPTLHSLMVHSTLNLPHQSSAYFNQKH